jgi:hypothetical protein
MEGGNGWEITKGELVYVCGWLKFLTAVRSSTLVEPGGASHHGILM